MFETHNSDCTIKIGACGMWSLSWLERMRPFKSLAFIQDLLSTIYLLDTVIDTKTSQTWTLTARNLDKMKTGLKVAGHQMPSTEIHALEEGPANRSVCSMAS